MMSVFNSFCSNGSALCPVVWLGLLSQVPELQIRQALLLRRWGGMKGGEGTYAADRPGLGSSTHW